MLFTRLPLWRLHQADSEAFCHSAGYWPLAGWITGGTMALTWALGGHILHHRHLGLALVIALAARMLLTGALHEDGLADLCDGMGGGHDRDRILTIMKDSHIGTYGVLGLMVYLASIYMMINQVALTVQVKTGEAHPVVWMMLAMVTIDVWAKGCSSLITWMLPYARTAQQAKTRVVYHRLHLGWHLLRMAVAMAPLIALWWWLGNWPSPFILLTPLAAVTLMALYLRHRIQGYTGDCCGATFLLAEASSYLTLIIYNP